MLKFILLVLFVVHAEVLPDNNVFMDEYKPPPAFAKKMQAKKKKMEKTMVKKACAPFLDPIECDVLSKINALRMNEGLAALLPAENCTNLSNAHTQYMVGLSNKGTPLSQALNHDRFKERVESFKLGTGKVSENVAAGSNLLPDQVVSMWLKSSGHRKNMMDPSMRYSGLSAIKDGKGNVFWTHCFSSKK